MYTNLPDAPIPDTSDFPDRLTSSAPIAGIPAPARGERLDLAEEMGRREADQGDDGTELPDVGPDGFSSEYDEFERWNARTALWLDGRGPRPE